MGSDDLDEIGTPNCPVHLTPMELAGTTSAPEWWCPDCALSGAPS